MTRPRTPTGLGGPAGRPPARRSRTHRRCRSSTPGSPATTCTRAAPATARADWTGAGRARAAGRPCRHRRRGRQRHHPADPAAVGAGVQCLAHRRISAAGMIAVYKGAIGLIHGPHLRAIGVTIAPFGRYAYWSPAIEAERSRSTAGSAARHAFDGVLDFDRAMRDPAIRAGWSRATTAATSCTPTMPATPRWPHRSRSHCSAGSLNNHHRRSLLWLLLHGLSAQFRVFAEPPRRRHQLLGAPARREARLRRPLARRLAVPPSCPLLAATERIVIATGIVNIWNYADPAVLAAGHAALTAEFPGRLLLGIGIGHPEAIQQYPRPLTKSEFLDGLDAAPQPVPKDELCIAALGPKMLDLAASAPGARTRTSSRPRTRGLRASAAAPRRWSHRSGGRRRHRRGRGGRPRASTRACTWPAQLHQQSPAFGFTEADIADGGSDRLIDAIVPQGSAAHSRGRARAPRRRCRPRLRAGVGTARPRRQNRCGARSTCEGR